MGRTRLQALAVAHHRFHGIRRDSARKTFLFRLAPRQYGNSKAVVYLFFIHAEHRKRKFFRFFRARMRRMPLVP